LGSVAEPFEILSWNQPERYRQNSNSQSQSNKANHEDLKYKNAAASSFAFVTTEPAGHADDDVAAAYDAAECHAAADVVAASDGEQLLPA